MSKLLQSIFGSRNDRWLKSARAQVEKINALEQQVQQLSDEQILAAAQQLRHQASQSGSLDDLLPRAYALVREAAYRTLGLRAFDVQVLGAIALHQAMVAQMRTGEGKTLAATFPAFLNALSGRGVHIVTVNDYLARRDAQAMGRVFKALGLTTGVIQHGQPREERKQAYACDITYGTNNEFGFDFLRDNLATEPDARVQRTLAYAIIDEVDSILIDEARTPLIISGPQHGSQDLYAALDAIAMQLTVQATEDGPGDFHLDPKTRAVSLSEDGHEHADRLLEKAGLLPADLYQAQHLNLLQHLNAALRARHAFARDKDYMVVDGKVVIVDEFTGRALSGRRWGEGLHQAIEAKEGVAVQPEDHVLASITLQNFFRSYERICGMTGTADTEATELQEIYGLQVVVIPTHRPMIREDREDLVFLTKKGKFNAVIAEIKDCAARRQPVLVGTTSIEVSEALSDQLKSQGIAHEVLNAKQHEREAHIIANAGRPGAVTIATNMAGRGTDIVLGGHPPSDDADEGAQQHWQVLHDQAIAAGGLHVIGTERHESRRIDNQLRGRSGRQGDPGSSRFFLSAEDHVLKAFMPDWSRAALARMGMQEDQPIEARLISRQVEAAQRRIEGFYFDQRKALIDYDDVSNQQRQVIYAHRQEIVNEQAPVQQVEMMVEQWARQMAADHLQAHRMDAEQHLDQLADFAAEQGLKLDVSPMVQPCQDHNMDVLASEIASQARQRIKALEGQWGEATMQVVMRAAVLAAIDGAWQEHMSAMAVLRSGIHLRAMGQKNPKQEYKREAFAMFRELTQGLPRRTLQMIWNHEPSGKVLQVPDPSPQ